MFVGLDSLQGAYAFGILFTAQLNLGHFSIVSPPDDSWNISLWLGTNDPNALIMTFQKQLAGCKWKQKAGEVGPSLDLGS